MQGIVFELQLSIYTADAFWNEVSSVLHLDVFWRKQCVKFHLGMVAGPEKIEFVHMLTGRLQVFQRILEAELLFGNTVLLKSRLNRYALGSSSLRWLLICSADSRRSIARSTCDDELLNLVICDFGRSQVGSLELFDVETIGLVHNLSDIKLLVQHTRIILCRAIRLKSL